MPRHPSHCRTSSRVSPFTRPSAPRTEPVSRMPGCSSQRPRGKLIPVFNVFSTLLIPVCLARVPLNMQTTHIGLPFAHMRRWVRWGPLPNMFASLPWSPFSLRGYGNKQKDGQRGQWRSWTRWAHVVPAPKTDPCVKWCSGERAR